MTLSKSLLVRRWFIGPLALIIVVYYFRSTMLEAAVESARTLCLTNSRRISTALLLYCQDHDGSVPPPAYATTRGDKRLWISILQPYMAQEQSLVCPLISIEGAQESFHESPMTTTYALNARFFGWFTTGSFPMQNLELPGQTALLVESQPVTTEVKGRKIKRARLTYVDMMNSRPWYPNLHAGRINVAAADGHVASVCPAHYGPEFHSVTYGRLGGSIFNWNGGYANGNVQGPPYE